MYQEQANGRNTIPMYAKNNGGLNPIIDIENLKIVQQGLIDNKDIVKEQNISNNFSTREIEAVGKMAKELGLKNILKKLSTPLGFLCDLPIIIGQH